MTDQHIIKPAAAEQTPAPFSNDLALESSMRAAKALNSSSIVPESFQGARNMGNVLIALELAQRLGTSPMAVMQNLHIIHGKPGFSAQFMISVVNSCGRFSPLRFRMTGEGDGRQCIAYATDLESGETVEGPAVSIAMAKAEGWLNKSGSKWRSMPELMLRYRAAAFFSRLYAPDLMMGFMTTEELADIRAQNKHAAADALMKKLQGKEQEK